MLGFNALSEYANSEIESSVIAQNASLTTVNFSIVSGTITPSIVPAQNASLTTVNFSLSVGDLTPSSYIPEQGGIFSGQQAPVRLSGVTKKISRRRLKLRGDVSISPISKTAAPQIQDTALQAVNMGFIAGSIRPYIVQHATMDRYSGHVSNFYRL